MELARMRSLMAAREDIKISIAGSEKMIERTALNLMSIGSAWCGGRYSREFRNRKGTATGVDHRRNLWQ